MKKGIRRALLPFLLSILLLLPQPVMAGASSGNPSITLMMKAGGTLKNRTVSVGSSFQIRAGYNAELPDPGTLHFQSSDSSVVSVTRSGVLTARKTGSAEICVYTADRRLCARLRLTVIQSVLEGWTETAGEEGRDAAVWGKSGRDDYI